MRRSTGRPPFFLFLIAIVVGVAFFIVDNRTQAPSSAPTPTAITPDARVDSLDASDSASSASTDEARTDSTTEEAAATVEEAATDEVATVATEEATRPPATVTPSASDTPDAAPSPTRSERSEVPPDSTLFIPSAAILSDIVQAYLDGQSWDVSQLSTNVGHLEGTAWVDRPGNVVLSGHVEMSDGRRGVFASLDELQEGDLLVLTSEGVEYTYVVTDVYITEPDDLAPLQPTTSEHRLTLITCGAYDFFSDAYLERVIVVAERTES